MQKSIITLLCVAGLAISAPSQADVQLKPGAPSRYVVKNGDTLWDISKRFLKYPWQWAQLWGFNRQQIKSPHNIYPGQVLVLSYNQGSPRLSVDASSNPNGIPMIKLSPEVHDVSSGYSIPTLPISVLRSFMDYPQIIPRRATMHAPVLVAGPDKRILYSVGDRVYAQGVKKPGRYLVYHINGNVYDPQTHKLLGQEVVYKGEVATITSPSGSNGMVRQPDAVRELLPDERYTKIHPLLKIPTTVATPLKVVNVVSEIEQGDKLRYLDPANEDNRYNFMPHEPFANIRAQVIRIFNGIAESGQYQTVLLNKGSLEGVDPGTILNLYHYRHRYWTDNRLVNSAKTNSTLKELSIPAEQIGLAMVYEVGANLSYALILDSSTSVTIGDLAANPGLDLQDINIPTPHIPNKK